MRCVSYRAVSTWLMTGVLCVVFLLALLSGFGTGGKAPSVTKIDGMSHTAVIVQQGQQGTNNVGATYPDIFAAIG